VPQFGYVGASWATFVVYLMMLIASYLLGQKYYPIEYDLRRVIGYPASVALIVWLYLKYLPMEGAISWVLKCLILLAFVGAVWLLEVRKKTVISSPST
jgi:O-antigen/teichoic acid export membrane protein